MDATQLFNFRFVDREHEREVLNNFFINNSESTLWIKGNSGIGKTTFFKYMYEKWNNYSLCYIDIKADATSIEIISEFIFQLQKNCGIDFATQLKNKYKNFYNNVYKKAQDITKLAFPQISNIVSIILDLSYTVVTIDDENKNCLEVVIDYIRTILCNKKLCICIDNFSRCDLTTASIFFQIFKTFLSDNSFRSCIITTTEDLKEDLGKAIYLNLPYTQIEIDALNECTYFGQILEPIFDISNLEKDDFEHIRIKCKGSPQKLSTLISKLLDKNGITIEASGKARIDKNVLYLILQKQYVNFNETDFTPAQKWIIFTYICLKNEVEIMMLKECAIYISKKVFLFGAYDEKIFNEELLNLCNNKILKYNPSCTISAYHDNEYGDLLDIFEDSQFKYLFHQYTYEFLSKNYSDEKKLLCKHACEAKIQQWENMNFKYGKFLAKSKQYYDAQKIFENLNPYLTKMNIMQALYIAINSYETGHYKLAIEQLQVIDYSKLNFKKAKYYYFFYIGKSYNNIGNILKAVEMLEYALNEAEKDSEEYVKTLNVLHMYYLEIPGERNKAFKFFTEIKDNYKSMYPQIWANTMRGCHNFMGNEDALVFLNEAENLLENELEKAYVQTTIGFVYIRMDQLDKAESQFETACKVIKRLKIHEYSYAMNNFAICYMLNDNYQKAKDILLEALFWNRTEYGKLAIQCQLLACAISLKQKDEAMDYYDYLKNYIEKHTPKDYVIKRKIYLNLAIANKKLNNNITMNAYLNKVEPYVKNSSSEWRYNNLVEKQTTSNKTPPILKYQCVMDFEPWFLIYAHD